MATTPATPRHEQWRQSLSIGKGSGFSCKPRATRARTSAARREHGEGRTGRRQPAACCSRGLAERGVARQGLTRERCHARRMLRIGHLPGLMLRQQTNCNKGRPSKVPASVDHGMPCLGSSTAWRDVQRHLISVGSAMPELRQPAPVRSCLQCFRVAEQHPELQLVV